MVRWCSVRFTCFSWNDRFLQYDVLLLKNSLSKARWLDLYHYIHSFSFYRSCLLKCFILTSDCINCMHIYFWNFHYVAFACYCNRHKEILVPSTNFIHCSNFFMDNYFLFCCTWAMVVQFDKFCLFDHYMHLHCVPFKHCNDKVWDFS